jgi:benzoyl-CoA reductase/2-hydroxyglutaryl-CoA dehydratase subunit BcrC/BadD/HgdB
MMEICDGCEDCEAEKVGHIAYPEEIREEFIRTPGYTFEDGTYVSTEEMWRFMTEEAPVRFPYSFIRTRTCGGISRDVTLFSGIKRYYLGFSGWDRMVRRQRNGRPFVVVQGGYPGTIYNAANCETVGPAFARAWLWRKIEGQGLKESEQRLVDLLEEYRKSLPAECCNAIASYPVTCNPEVPIGMVAPCTAMYCSDAIYAMESCQGDRKLPTYVADFPVNHFDGQWRVEYLSKGLRKLAEKLGEVSGKTVTDDILKEQIKLENRSKQLGMECQRMWWNAKVPPTNSDDNCFAGVGSGGFDDFILSAQFLKESREELTQRIKKGIKGYGLSDDPSRVFICGSCACVDSNTIEDAGGVFVGNEVVLSLANTMVKETGDPYDNLAEAWGSMPYERSPEDRAEFAARMVKESRADGVIFVYNWGCNYQSSVSRMITDIIKERTGVPTTCIEVGELGRMQGSEQTQNRIEAFMEMIH